MKLRVVPSALSLILGGVSPVRSPSRQPRRRRPSPPAGISNHHRIAGASGTAGGYSQAVMWSNGTMAGFGTFGLDPVGATINNHGVIVGQSSLNATAINDDGRIAASGFNARGQEHAFLLTELVSAPRTCRPSA